MSVTAVIKQLPTQNTTLEDAVTRKIAELLGPGSDMVGVTSQLYQAIMEAAQKQNVTVVRPVVGSGYATLKYDYMSGYLMMFIMGVVGIGLTVWFGRLEKQGRVCKRGIMEAQAIQDDDQTGSGTYVPGYYWQKATMIAFGVAILGVGFAWIWGPASLLITGKRVQAETSAIIAVAPDAEERYFTNDLEVSQITSQKSHALVFWNDFRFLADNQVVTVRSPVGNRVRPLFPLLDADGLPTIVTLFYDPQNPSHTVIPSLYSIWFLPGILLLIGTFLVVVGSILLANARRPIVLPVILDPEASKSA